MSLTAARPVVVGVPAGNCPRLALEFALHEARRRRSPIRLVHGLAPAGPEPTFPQSPPADPRGGRAPKVLERAVGLLRSLGDSGVEIETVTSPITGLEALLAEGRGAAVMVLQRRDLSHVAPRSTSTVTLLAAQAACPVVLVRNGGDFRPDGPVVVGVAGSPEDATALEVAFEEAALRAAPLLAVHAWGSPSLTGGYGSHGTSGEQVADRRERARGTLAAAVHRYADAYPGVVVQQRLLDSPAAVALLHVSGDARLLVLGRGPEPRLGLGPVVRQCLASARCPTMVAPSSKAPEEQVSGDETGSAGQPPGGDGRSS